MRFNRPSLAKVIDNVRGDRDRFVTDEAWEAALEMYEAALKFLDAQEKSQDSNG